LGRPADLLACVASFALLPQSGDGGDFSCSILSLKSLLRAQISRLHYRLFIIFTGGGRNGKSLVVEWHQFTLGKALSAQGHLCLLTKPMKDGPNTELRDLHKKYTVVFSEPEEGAMEALRLSEIKKLTGNEQQNARGLYDSDSDTRIFATTLFECNKLPVIKGDKGTAAYERVGAWSSYPLI